MFNFRHFLISSLTLIISIPTWSKTVPYLKSLSKDSVEIRWESTTKTYQLNLSSSEGFFGKFEPEIIYERKRFLKNSIKFFSVKVNNLEAGRTYFYELKTSSETLGVYRFKTITSDQNRFSFILMADAQKGSELTEEIVKKSIMPKAFLNTDQRSLSPINFILFAGDLVHRGFLHSHWESQFFSPLQSILSRTPVIPSIGNHEYNSQLFWKYFYRNSQDNKFHFFDKLTSRFITLSTNRKSRKVDQLDWLKLTLSDAKEKDIKFIFIQYHHPAFSEIWPKGEKKYSKKIESILRNFSKNFDGHLIIMNGHTHAYSRGHDPDQKLTHIISGPLGGKIDYWNKKSRDYKMFQVNSSTPGWSIFDIKPNRITHRYYGYNPKNKETTLLDEYSLSSDSDLPMAPNIISTTVTSQNLVIKLEKKEYVSLEVLVNSGEITKRFYLYGRNDVNGQTRHNDLSSLELKLPHKLTSKSITIKIRGRNKNLDWSQYSETYDIGNQ